MTAPLALADDLWMVAHDRPNGASFLGIKPLGIGLGAALIAELIMANWLNLADGALYVHPQASRYPPPADPATADVFGRMQQEEAAQRGRRRDVTDPVGLSVEEWIQHLHNGHAQQLVERRLTMSGLAVEESRGGLFRSSRTVVVPQSSSVSGWPAARVRDNLREGQQLSEQDLTLAGLIVATGLAKEALGGIGGRQREFLVHQTQAIMRLPLRELVICAETAVGRLIMIR
ncbi:GOLPH3/VPS74 family protein [Mangrovihabitans endophyticus]|uniref:Golgi phosphoprotein 3 GPP34 n=1 Tax=Mangrovihabitans endophyticus TaxID=1751298 RepID=A0A8J3C306_9ACTN|nr:GPP34 family phosphoprotein [Mangrovihabitans endophyticus]GGL11256.1 hypothetical protein GCM10012284_52520 [Mangrovihabitans endophyticus]